MAKKKDPGYRVLNKETRKVPHTLNPEEREKLRDRENELGEKVLKLEDDHKAKVAEKNEEARARRDAIKEARAAWSEAVAARKTGVSQVERQVEVRAVVATRTIDTVVVRTGEVLESRPMTEEEKRDHLQGSLDVGGASANDDGADEGAETPAVPGDEPSGVELWEDAVGDDAEGRDVAGVDGEGPAAEGDAVEVPQADALDEGEASALGLPPGWPRSWRGGEWPVKVERDELMLRESDVHDVFLRLQADGTTIPVLLNGRDGVGPIDWLERQRVAYALKLLSGVGLAAKVGRGAWAPTDRTATAQEPEPGRSDQLPEAGDITRPRLGEPQTEADALLADAGDTAAAWTM